MTMQRVLMLMRRFAWLGWLLSAPVWWYGYKWAADRTAPFEVYSVAASSALPGARLDIAASVRRDLARECDATFTRWLYDSRGYRYDMEGSQEISADGIEKLDRRAPGELKMSVALPPTMAPGPAMLHAEMLYRCNPLHFLWPIPVTTDIPFEVLKP